MSEAKRFNTGKSQLSMILEAKHALEGIASVMQFGAQKYERSNWRRGLKHTQICDSMLRHLSAYLSGETYDKESGLHHAFHIATNALFLAEHVVTHPNLDDRAFVSTVDEHLNEVLKND
jgi:hypothetical protein